jgi:cytochrome c
MRSEVGQALSRRLPVAVLLAAASLAGAPQDDNAQKLIQASDCSSCHAVDHQVVGPAYSEVAKRYAGQADAAEKLAAKIRDGGSGMTPHPDLTEAQRRAIVTWILSQKDSAAAPSPAAAKLYTYTMKDGTTIQVDFQVMLDGPGQKVTKDVFHGYQLWNSYCYRCHGTDATGGQLAPDLRRSLAAGMTLPDFLAVTMTGRKEKGMPSWAGFLSEQDVTHVYKYAKGRSLGLVPVGRPPSEQD